MKLKIDLKGKYLREYCVFEKPTRDKEGEELDWTEKNSPLTN